MSAVKNQNEITTMTEGGKRLGAILSRLMNEVKVGAVPLEIDALAQKLIQEAGGTPSFFTVGDYKWATCISVNEGVVHGVPNNIPFKDGDIVSIDIGILYQGYHADASWSKIVTTVDSEVNKKNEAFLRVGEEALYKGIAQARPGNRIGHISQAIQQTVESAGYKVVKNLVGHGIGKKLHESPQVPGILVRPIEKTPALVENMTLAIEVIYCMGRSEITHANDDGWTLVTADGSLAGLFESTVLITAHEPIVLTRLS